MEFFNKKEEVIDLKLTQFGRLLLSKGKFKPVYYSFFDNDILYDVAKVDLSERQNESEKRIVETPTMHPQVSFFPLEIKQFFKFGFFLNVLIVIIFPFILNYLIGLSYRKNTIIQVFF